jgi:hypothetical protein
MRYLTGVLIAASLFSGVVVYGQQLGGTAIPNESVRFHATLSAQEKQHVLDGSCSVIASTKAMPQSLRNGFAKVTREQKFELADPGDKFQETDVIVTRGLPWRRLVFAGSCGERWFIHYEHGGFAHSNAVLIFAVDGQGAMQFVWGGAGFYRAKDVDDLRQGIASGKFADDREYYW